MYIFVVWQFLENYQKMIIVEKVKFANPYVQTLNIIEDVVEI